MKSFFLLSLVQYTLSARELKPIARQGRKKIYEVPNAELKT